VDIERINKIVNENKYWILLGISFTLIFYLQVTYGLISGVWNYFFYEEPPIYVVKSTSILNLGNFNADLNTHIDFFLYDFCGDRIGVISVLPEKYRGITEMHREFFDFGELNISYSISIITEKENVIVRLLVSSEDTDFQILPKNVGVKIDSEAETFRTYKKIVIYDSSNSIEKSNYIANILPNEKGDISINCLNDNCQIIEIKRYLLNFPYVNNLYNNSGYNGSYVDIDLKRSKKLTFRLPEPVFDQIKWYVADFNSGEFIELSTSGSKKSGSRIVFGNLTCNQKEIVYTLI